MYGKKSKILHIAEDTKNLTEIVRGGKKISANFQVCWIQP